MEQRRDHRGVAEQFAPVVDRAVRGQHRRGPLIAPHAHLRQVPRAGVWQLSHPEVVDDEQRDGGEHREERLARAVEGGFDDLVDERMSRPIEDPVASVDGGTPNDLRR